jgi:ribosomal-protein-alanine N-acetyltransferase
MDLLPDFLERQLMQFPPLAPCLINWMMRRHMPEVLAIEESEFENPWTEEDFIRVLKNRNSIGVVAEHREKIVGYAVYELLKDRVNVLNFAVHEDVQRRRVGTQMIQYLKRKLTSSTRSRLAFTVRDSNTPAHLFLRASGFRAVNVLRGFYTDMGDDAYLFHWHSTKPASMEALA